MTNEAELKKRVVELEREIAIRDEREKFAQMCRDRPGETIFFKGKFGNYSCF